jgi:hypothetical protein
MFDIFIRTNIYRFVCLDFECQDRLYDAAAALIIFLILIICILPFTDKLGDMHSAISRHHITAYIIWSCDDPKHTDKRSIDACYVCYKCRTPPPLDLPAVGRYNCVPTMHEYH